MMLGEIQAHQPEGAPEGVSEVALANRPLRALRIPRETLGEAHGLSTLSGFGLFFLVGSAAYEGGRPRAYIGAHRQPAWELSRHLRHPPFPWTAAVVVPVGVPKVPRYHKELTKLIQFHCHRHAVRVNHHEVVNAEPTCPSRVPNFLDRDLKTSRTGIQTLLFALGHPILGTQLRVVK